MAIALGSCGPVQPVQGFDADGPTFVSLNPCLDAILVEVADPEQILALSHYSRDPTGSSIGVEVASKFGVTGGTAEEVLALQPDIILASTFIGPATRAAFERMGLRVETFGSPNTIADSLDQIEEVAKLAGQVDEGKALIDQIGAANERPDGASFSALLWQPGQIVPGEATLVSEHLRWARLRSHSEAQGLGQADYVSLEALLADPPDILLIAGDRPGQTHPLLEEQSGMLVAEYDPRLLYCGGPTIPHARARLLEVREQFQRDFWRGAHP